MSEHEEIRQWLFKAVQSIGDHPEDVALEATTIEERTTFRIRANRKDIDKVIGRQGRTSQSLRVLAGAMGKKLQCRFFLKLTKKLMETNFHAKKTCSSSRLCLFFYLIGFYGISVTLFSGTPDATSQSVKHQLRVQLSATTFNPVS